MAKLHRGQLNALSEYVKGIPVEGNWFSINLDSLPALEKQILGASPWRELLKRGDLFQVLLHATSKFLKHIEERANGFSGRLNESAISDLIPEIENDLIVFLESMPRPYCICFYLPKFSKFSVSHTNLAQDISLLDTSAPDFREALLRSQNSLAEVLARTEPSKFERNSAYLEFFVPGYADYSLSSYSLARAYSRLKEFVFLGIQKNIIREKGLRDISVENQGSAFLDTSSLHAVVYNRDDISECYRVVLPDDASRYLRWLRIEEAKLTTYVPGKTALTGSTRAAETPEEKSTALQEEFKLVTEFLDIDPNDSDAERIRTAIEWCFDADIAENETVSFIQRCIGLEAILGVKGDDQVRSITDRLSDRYSYLLGVTVSERTRLKDHFKKIYGKRSDLVHARRSVLSLTDDLLSVESKFMLNQVVIKEVNGLLTTLRKKSEEKGNPT
jgi:hypothetical protein